MAKNKSKSKPKKPAKLKDKAKGVAKSILGAVSGKKSPGGKRKKKHSALWYAKEIQRLQLKKKYEKQKMRL